MEPRGIRNCNPGNIRITKDKWQGLREVQEDKEFFQFKAMKWGYRAMIRTLQNYRKRHGCETIADFIRRWAPPTENETDKYVDFVCKWSGLKGGFVLRFISDFASVLAAMEMVEIGVPASKRAEYYATAKDSYIYLSNHFNVKPYEGKS